MKKLNIDWLFLIEKALKTRVNNANLDLPFRSEADLQFSLGVAIQDENPEIGIHLEYRRCIEETFDWHPIDIVLIQDKKKYAVELKYSAWKDGDCIAGTKDSYKCAYNFLYDIYLIEKRRWALFLWAIIGINI